MIRVLALLGCLALASACAVARPAPQPGHAPHYARTAWASLHGDSRNSDSVPFLVPAQSRVVWEALDGAALFVGPTIGPEGQVYVTSGRGFGTSHLHAFDRDGRLLWESKAMNGLDDLDYGAGINAPLVDADGTIFVGDLNQLWAFAADGTPKWSASLSERGASGHFVTAILSHEGHVGGITTDGKVLFFERDSGDPVWEVLDLPGVAGPDGQPAPAGLLAGGLFAPEFIQPMWNLIFGWEIEVANTPAVHPDTGRIYITAGGALRSAGVLYGLDTGEHGVSVAFAAPLAAGSGTSPAISPDGELVYASGGDGVMVAFDAASGFEVWRAEGVQGAASPTVGRDGTVYSFDGAEVVALEGRSGELRWRVSLASLGERWLEPADWRGARTARVNGVMTATRDKLLVALDVGYWMKLASGPAFLQPHRFAIAALDRVDGRVIGLTEMRDSSSALIAPNADGRLYVSLVGATTSMQYYGLNPRLPESQRTPVVPKAGLIAFEPVSPAHHARQVVDLLRAAVAKAARVLVDGDRLAGQAALAELRAPLSGLPGTLEDAVARGELDRARVDAALLRVEQARAAIEVSAAVLAADVSKARRMLAEARSAIALADFELGPS